MSSALVLPQRTPIIGVAASVAIHILALAVPLAMFQAYDRILPSQTYGTTFVLAVGVPSCSPMSAPPSMPG
jgi:ABC-type protease/lipase transport system fused ATPase/permease subunit